MYGDGLQFGVQAGSGVERQPTQPSDTLFVGGLPQDLAETVSVVVVFIVVGWCGINGYGGGGGKRIV